ncbi:MAG: HK97 family phage prohead protease [bacterium]|nr:HK97 family phage prohead protease [bacterium]
MLRLRADPDGGPGIISGPVAVYGDYSPGFRERIAPGAFSGWGNVELTLQHEFGLVITDSESGRLTLTDGPERLRAEAVLPDSPLGRVTAELIDRGTLTGLSAAYAPGTDEPEPDGGHIVRRGHLLAVGVVDRAAFPESRVILTRAEGKPDVTWQIPDMSANRGRGRDRAATQRALIDGLPNRIGRAPWWLR